MYQIKRVLLVVGSFFLIVTSLRLTPAMSIHSTVCSNTNLSEKGYEIIIDGRGVDSLLPVLKAHPSYSVEYPGEKGYILAGRGSENSLYLSIIPGIIYLNKFGGVFSHAAFARFQIQLFNATIVEINNTLKFFNWPRTTMWNEVWQIYDWIEVDEDHYWESKYHSEDWDANYFGNIRADFPNLESNQRKNVPDWWLDKFPGYWDNDTSTGRYPVYDVLELKNTTDVFVETTAMAGTDSFAIKFNITQHPAFVRLIPLMDHVKFNCEETIYVGRQGLQYQFNELIPLTKDLQGEDLPPVVTPIQGNPPIIVSPAVAGIVNPLASLVSIVSLSGAVSVVGVSSAVLTIVITLSKHPQLVPVRRRFSRKKPPRDQSLLLQRALQANRSLSSFQTENTDNSNLLLNN